MTAATGHRRPGLVYVVHSLDPGGTERLAFDMGIAFSGEYNVSVVCLDTPGAWAEDLRSEGVPVHCAWRQPGLDLTVASRIAYLCRRADAAIVHAHQCTPWFYAALARLLHPKSKLLLEEHGRFYPEADSAKRRIFNRLVISPLTHRVVAVSEDVRDRLVRYEGLRREKIRVIYNGVRRCDRLPEDRRRELRHELGFKADEFVVGTVGRLDPIKNLPMFVDALKAASASLPKLRGLIVGDGPEYASLVKKIDAVGLSSEIRLTGYRADARCLSACMDIFVLPSFSEGISMALLEATAAEVPVIVTDVGGNPEVVLRDKTGIVVPSDDATALAAAIVRSAEQRDRARSMAEAARRRYEDNFSFEGMLDRYRETYRHLLDGRAPARV